MSPRLGAAHRLRNRFHSVIYATFLRSQSETPDLQMDECTTLVGEELRLNRFVAGEQ